MVNILMPSIFIVIIATVNYESHHNALIIAHERNRREENAGARRSKLWAVSYWVCFVQFAGNDSGIAFHSY